MQPRRLYEIGAHLQDIVIATPHSIELVFRTEVLDEDNRLLEYVDDVMYVKNCSPQTIKQIKQLSQYGHHKLFDVKAIRDQKSTLKGKPDTTFYVEHGLGLKYGKLSGDINMVHTTDIMAKFFGYKKAFIQGLCTGNLVIKTLLDKHHRYLEHFSISFRRPIYTEQSIKIFTEDGKLEVLDEQGELCAFGDYKLSDEPVKKA